MSFPTYITLSMSGELGRRARELWERLGHCDICPRICGVNRIAGKIGKCRSRQRAIVSQASPHFGEESPLVGSRGSGTIFFASCNLSCIYCQNYDISKWKKGEEFNPEYLAAMMLKLQRLDCHNINLVTPTHFVPQIVKAIDLAAKGGLSIPIVYNSGGYESVATLEALEGVIDIYMPDFKYWDDDKAFKYSGVRNYREVACSALLEMHRQVGDLEFDDIGIARKGLLIRHLLIPNDIAGSDGVLGFIAEKISRNSYVNIMSQYRPCFQAWRHPELNRGITITEFKYAIRRAEHYGLRRGFPEL